MSAREQLAASHARMTPEAIAAHALTLATLLEANERLIGKLYDQVDSLDDEIEASERLLHAVGLLPTVRTPIDRSMRKPLLEVWPEIYSPGGGAS
ncbi:hypothetical protein [Mesorhizobium sp. M4B.F.Ca.ET.013.02.1.1]|uniref:hypothetical protein n=1 Tax=Mesorhizobium sp. M4B.F.Ca.ET.013.02.1.1 TaxID=2496755 RepID=UPI000FD477FF|nr:hypothetical protein [Mesorhizobium sp. M4B.F.Ca.ET.013.02.1.1]RUW18710.1 hypothetical protein EOA34_31415 [Mesorhizobium sp. M4B.F.Ca.ET.013.02.1.1]